MYQAGITNYINQNVKNPVFSKVYWTPAVIDGGEYFLSRLIDQQNVKLIITQQIFFRPTSGAVSVSLQDVYGNTLFTFDATGINSNIVINDFVYIFDGNRIVLRTPSTTLVQFSVSYQYVMEGTSKEK